MMAEGKALQTDVLHPIRGLYPTSQWQKSTAITDVISVELPTAEIPESVLILVYRQVNSGEFENLSEFTLPLQPPAGR